MASALRPPQAAAEKLDINRQQLIAAKVLSHGGYFLLKNEGGESTPAKHIGDGVLVAGSEEDSASAQDINAVYKRRIRSILVDAKGSISTFEDASIDEQTYLDTNKKLGYANLPLKLAYEVYPNPDSEGRQGDEPESVIIPVTGFGLWDRIYGFVAVEPNGTNVVGISWYKHGETPGLGANIAIPDWQAQFPGKFIFQKDAQGSVNIATAPIGIDVRRGKVVDELGDSPKADSAVDGMAGATLTGVGVSKAYKDSLGPYRPFLIQMNKKRS